MKIYKEPDWEVRMFLDRYPQGCPNYCDCNHPAEDCGCWNCQKRHAYAMYFSVLLKKVAYYRLN